MATVTKWTPFGVALDITATAGTVTRTSATQYTVKINASWETYYNGATTNYGMTASSGGGSATINKFGTYSSSGSGSFTGTYSISGNGSATKTVTVTFKNFNSDNDKSATKTVSFSVTVPAWTSYTVKYNMNGGSGSIANQTKWKDQTLTLSSTKPTRTGYSFKGWATSASGAVTYASGASYTANAAITLYAVWQPNTYTVSYNANGGTGAPGNQTKTYGTDLTLSSTEPTRLNYNFKGWGVSASATTVKYASGAKYTANEAATLYAVWELAYTKPRITKFTVARCTSNGTLADDGTFALVKFDWACDKTLSSIIIVAEGTALVKMVAASGNSGSVSQIFGDGSLSTDQTFTITVHVEDQYGYTDIDRTLNSQKFLIDGLPENKGVAFGKAAELEDTAEFAYDAKFNKPVYGKALGMDRLPHIPNGSDLNDYKEPGCWAIYSNSSEIQPSRADMIYCGGKLLGTDDTVPPARAGRFEVWSATGEGVRAEQWSYLRQRYIPYNSENAVWERDVTRGVDNVWVFYEWYKSSLTPAASDKVYNKSAITVCLTANITELTTNTYTKVAFNKTLSTMGNKLSLSDNSVLIGAGVDYVKASAQILFKVLKQGSKHFKINKISNGTTTSFSWICQESDPITNASGAATATGVGFYMPPIVIPVKEGDYITCTYYTGNSTDYIVSGSAAGGAQTYFTVEEL